MLADHGGRVAALLRQEFRSILDSHEVEDALSQAAVRVWRAAVSYDPCRGTLGAWLFVIAQNCARHSIEAKQRHARLKFVADLDGMPAPSDGAVFVPQRRGPGSKPPRKLLRAMWRCIDDLAPQQRAVLRADFAAGGIAPAAQLAAELQTTRNSIYVSRNNGLKALRAAMQDLGHVDAAPRDDTTGELT